MRDLTARQFRESLTRHGMRLVGFMGYVEMLDGKLAVSMLNANTKNRRARLAYLLREKDKFEREQAVTA
jgi:hypothetical protein